MKPVHYSLHLEPDLEQFVFRGRTEIEILSQDLAEQIVLNTAGLALTSCLVQRGGQELACGFSVDAEREEVVIHLPEAMGGADPVHLILEYTGELNDQLRGFYRSKYEYDGREKYIAVTQFEERDARRAFPCFDHPAKKATFDIEFLIDNGLTGIANTAVKEEVLQGDKKLVRFERTPKMSTYLLSFCVGEFEFIQDDSERPVIRVAATPGKIQYGDFALQMGRKALKFGEEYTGIEFPISKCDHVAVPDFAFGAMENYGAITYRENLLLLYPGTTSRVDVRDMAAVIAHETIHMWFGDLVSPAEWKYIWLNESFASYFTVVITDHYYPEWDLQGSFLVENKSTALERDSLLETVPVELPLEEGEVYIDPSSAPIIYRKGASIIRMLADHLGEEQVRKGINHFLGKFKFDCATSRQYWEAFEEATGEPVGAFADSWVYQPGYPLVRVRREGNELHLSQQRFTFVSHASDQLWLVPINILVYLEGGDIQTIRVLLQEKGATVPIPEETVAFLVNHGQVGFYRVEYEKSALDQLGQLIKERKLSAADSFGVESDLFALLRSGDLSLTDYLAFVENCFEQEDRFLPLLDISDHLMTLFLVVEGRRDEIARVGRPIFEQALEHIGLEPQSNESLQVSQIRDALLWSAFTFGSGMAAEFGTAQFQGLLDGKAVHEDILHSVLSIGAATNDGALDYFAEKLRSADTPEPEKLAILHTMGHLRERDKLLAALEMVLKEVPKKNQAYTIGAAATNPAAVGFMWQWFVDNLEDLAQFIPGQFARVIVSLIPVCGLGMEAEVERVLTEIGKEHPRAQGTATMALEILEVYSRLGGAN